MATIESIIRNRKGTAGSSGAWRVIKEDRPANVIDGTVYTLWHYSTPMLTWMDCDEQCGAGRDFHCLYVSTGHGSVSDQSGMNKAFRTLGFSAYFSRAGGATITWKDES